MKFGISHEPSTYRGVIVVITVAVAFFKPELMAQLTAAGVSAAGLMGIFIRDN